MEGPLLMTILVFMAFVSGALGQNCTDDDVCYTKECISIATDMLKSMDQTINPCEDFYGYACGGFVRSHFLPGHRFRMGPVMDNQPPSVLRNLLAEDIKPTDLNAVRKAKNLYTSCLAYNPHEDPSLVRIINEWFDMWPMACAGCLNSSFNVVEILNKAVQLKVFPLFKLKATLHSYTKRRRRYVERRYLNIGEPVNNFKDRYFYWNMDLEPAYYQVYANTIVDVIARFGGTNVSSAREDAREIVEVDKRINKIASAFKTETKDKTVHNLGIVDESYGKFLNWTHFVNQLGSLPHVGVTNITNLEGITVSYPVQLKNILDYFWKLSRRTQVNYIIWRVVDTLLSARIPPNEFNSQLWHKMGLAITGVRAEGWPDEICQLYVSKAFPLVTHRLLYERVVTPERIQTVNSMIRLMRQEFSAMLDEHNWIDSQSLAFMKSKVEAITTIKKYYKVSMNDSYLENYYANVTVSNTSFLDNVIAIRMAGFARNFKSIRKLPNVRVRPLIYREYFQHYRRILNRIEYTSNLFEYPYFVADGNMTLNYAGLGTLFGSEFMRAFNSEGRKINSQLRFGSWWTDEMRTKFEQRSQCLVDQYNKYRYHVANNEVNGTQTHDTNLVENVGLKLAYRVFKQELDARRLREMRLPYMNMTDEQIFFLKYAQVSCTIDSRTSGQMRMADRFGPQELRVRGTLENSEDFARAFSCPPGSPMNPVAKCEVL